MPHLMKNSGEKIRKKEKLERLQAVV